MFVLIDPDRIDERAPVGVDYRDDLRIYYDVTKPIQVIGKLTMHDNSHYPDFYLAILNKEYELSPARLIFREETVRDKKGVWTPFYPCEGFADLISTFDYTNQTDTQFHWLPIFHTKPNNNKEAKARLVRYND